MTDSTASTPGALIAIDWGTSSLRAYLLGPEGEVIDSRSGDDGILAAAPDFDAAFDSYAGGWLSRQPDLPVIASGMIGSRQGWREVPYVGLPAGLNELADGLLEHTARSGAVIRFVPGISSTAHALPDVMRGEETQVLGALAAPDGDGLFVLPGTHSKWVRVQGGRIVDFRTFMTGELFQALRHHTVLGRLMRDDAPDAAAFGRGVAQTGAPGASSEGLVTSLFSVRTLGLFDQIAPQALSSYLSGLLIGAELRAATTLGFLADAMVPVLVGNDELSARYSTALAALGQPAQTGHRLAAPRGLLNIARRRGILA